MTQSVAARTRQGKHDILPGHIRAKTGLAELDARVPVLLRFNYFHGFRHVSILLPHYDLVKHKFHAVKIMMLGNDFEPYNTGPIE